MEKAKKTTKAAKCACPFCEEEMEVTALPFCQACGVDGPILRQVRDAGAEERQGLPQVRREADVQVEVSHGRENDVDRIQR